MKLVRYGPPGNERPGLVAPDGSLRDLSLQVQDIDPKALDPVQLAALRAIDPQALSPVAGAMGEEVRLASCVAPAGKIVCVGLNYADHARESGMAIPTEPVLFMKGTRLSGAADPIIIPPGSSKTDWEIELAIVIGRETLAVDEAQARDCIAGYAAFVDVSERAWQLERGGQWVKGKSYPSFAPLGPWLVTPDEIADPQDLGLWLDVNGKRRQDSSTAQMIFGVMRLVSYISHFMPLYPGDVIASGTPPGVGMGLKPEPVFLKPGDTIHCGIQGLGEQRHLCRAHPG